MKPLVPLTLALVALGCSTPSDPDDGADANDAGDDAGPGFDAGLTSECAPAGIWDVSYSAPPFGAPAGDTLVVVALADGGFGGSFGINVLGGDAVLGSYCGPYFYPVTAHATSFDAGSCDLSIREGVEVCSGFETTIDQRDLVLHFGGDALIGSGTGVVGDRVYPSTPPALTAFGKRRGSPVPVACNPYGTWKISYTPSASCVLADEVLTLSPGDGGGIEGAIPFDGGGPACGYPYHSLRVEAGFDEVRCTAVVTTGVEWCDGPDGGVIHGEQRSLHVHFEGDAGEGEARINTSACSPFEAAIVHAVRQ